jgi:hypothetical protein
MDWQAEKLGSESRNLECSMLDTRLWRYRLTVQVHMDCQATKVGSESRHVD